MMVVVSLWRPESGQHSVVGTCFDEATNG
jgi:hypothetical protein